ncbi:sensor histidine kinase [Paenibacillus sp. UNC451MF]|uniref:sensor histidine kinase n=1 Tax=Paenibacillus sp. UNC451MF TaxID=1449063 RepID=UPI00048C9BC1|nr:histidine kinase [Paenibacillus sp. UNC451MF]
MAKANQKVAQLGALKSQINPHFLANALETIQMKAILNGDRDTGEMVGLLGKLLYVKVQQMRFGDKIQYVENLTPGSETMHVIHFCLQPIIENAIIHGLETQVESGLLEVSTVIIEHELLIKVRDNGAGMNEQDLVQLQDRLKQHTDSLSE